jgi:hypothetical protein
MINSLPVAREKGDGGHEQDSKDREVDEDGEDDVEQVGHLELLSLDN